MRQWRGKREGEGRLTGILTNERNLEVVVYLIALVWIGSFAEVGNWLFSGGEVEFLDRAFHETDSPSEESAHHLVPIYSDFIS
jgi:hypothetical protein